MSTRNFPSVAIGSIAIRQDTDGRYSLNDLHQAAGGEKRHAPNYWLENQQTKELIAELDKSLNVGDTGIPVSQEINNIAPVVTIKGGKGKQGTYVVRELVYGYAMWISPAFHLKVIRTFDAVMTGNTAEVDTLTPSEQQALSEIVHSKVAGLTAEWQGKALAEIWSRIHHKFRIAKYSQLPRTQLSAVILYVTGMEIHCAQKATPAPAPAPALEYATRAQLDQISHHLHLLDYCVHTKDAFKHAAYAHLRRQFGLEKSIASLLAHQADDALAIAAEIERLGWAIKGLEIEVERKFYRHILRECHPFVLEEWQRIFDAEVAKLIDDRQSRLQLLGMTPTTTH